MIKIIYIPNILENEGRVERSFNYDRTLTVRDYIEKSGIDIKGCKVIVSGKKYDDLNATLKKGEEIIITPDVRITAVVAALTFFGGGSLIWGAIKAVAIVAMVAYGIYSMISQPRKPSNNLSSYASPAGIDQSSPTYGWDGIQTIQEVGVPVPIVYGEHKVGGNVVNSFIRYNGEDSYLHVLLALAEGEIESITDIKINDNPVENFEGVSTETRDGENYQTVVEGFEDAHNLYNVNVDLPKNTPYVYTTADTDVEALELHISCTGGLFTVTAGGGMATASITYQVEYKLHSEPAYTDLGEITFSGKTRSAIRKIYRIDGLTAGEYDVRITKKSDDSTATTQTDLKWTQVDEIKTDNLSYPNTALLGIEAMATNQLSGNMPNFTCIVKGRKVLAPTIMNGAVQVDWEDYYWDPSSSQYKLIEDDTVLSWDGSSFSAQYCANPIWCIKDLLSNARYGLGEFISSTLMSDSQLLSMSRYCEEKLDDGEEGYEKRFRLDVVIDGGGKALDVLSQIATVFRGLPFYSSGGIHIKIDKPETAVQMFTMGNIIKDSFVENWKSVKEKPNVIEVQYLNKDKDYKQEIVAYIDEVAVAVGDPLRKKTVKLFTTITSQAMREARYALNVAKYIDRTINFKAMIDAIACQAGDVISVAHDVIGLGESGRIKDYDAISGEITLDQEVTLAVGETYKLRIQFDDDTIEEKTVSTLPGTTDTIEVVGDPFTGTPAAYQKYMIGKSTLVKQDYRIISMSKNNNYEVEITAIIVDDDVYDDTAINIPDDNVIVPSYTTPMVSDLQLFERVLTAPDGTIESAIDIYFIKPSLDGYSEVNRYKGANIWIRSDEYQPWEYAGYTEGEYFQVIGDLQVGTTYYICVTSVPYRGNETSKTDSPNDDITLVGKTTNPSDVTNFVYDFTDQLTLTWNKIADADVAGYEIRTADSNWGVDNTDRIYRGQTNSHIYIPATRSPGTLYLKAFNTTGVYSENAVNVTPTNAAPGAPTGFSSFVFFNIAKLYWDNLSDADLKYYEIYRSETDAWAGEEILECQVSGKSVLVDAEQPVGGSATSDAGDSTIIDTNLIGKDDDFCVGNIIRMTSGDNVDEQKTITDFDGDTGTVTISGTWTTNPSENDTFVIYDKSYFKIRGVDSYGAGSFSSSIAVVFETLTEDSLGDAIITARKIYAGEVITLSAQIADAIITSAKILSVSADKITAGTIGAEEIILSADGSIRSVNYESEVSGFKLDGTDGLEVWSGSIKGTTIILGTVDEEKLTLTAQAKILQGHMVLNDTKSANTDGGTFTSGAFRTRDLNTEIFNNIANASLGAEKTLLLLHCDGSDDGTTFTDSCGRHTVTRQGDVVTKTGQKKFGTASAYFDGTGDYLTVPASDDWLFRNGDFTIDMWVRFSALSGTNQAIWSHATNGSNYANLIFNNSGYSCAIYTGNVLQLQISVTDVLSIDTWYHIALVRYGNTWSIYKDGTSMGSASSTFTYPDFTGEMSFGIRNYIAGTQVPFNGYLDEIRVVKGVAKWTSNFTPETSAYTDPTGTDYINSFTLPKGTYLIDAIVPGYNVNIHKSKLRNVTDGEDTLIGSSEMAASGVTSISVIRGVFTITSAKTFEIQHRCQTTMSTTGFGYASDLGVDEVYTQVEIIKLMN